MGYKSLYHIYNWMVTKNETNDHRELSFYYI